MRRFVSFSLVTLIAATAVATATSGPNSPGAGPDPNRVVRIAVLQAGTEHSKKGHPGCAANFRLLAGLARVKKMYNGLGDRKNPKAGGHGLICLDDIRAIKSRTQP